MGEARWDIPGVSATKKPEPKSYDETISEKGFRFTDQRRAVYDALMGKRDHPTAVEVFMRVKSRMPSISLATVYNCLETLTGCGLVKAVNHDREPSRYCPNLNEHAHLFCEGCGGVVDVPLRTRRRLEDVWEVPESVVISQHEVSFRGLCPKCAAKENSRPFGKLRAGAGAKAQSIPAKRNK